MTDSHLLEEIGISLFGRKLWKADLATALGVTRPTVDAMHRGTMPVPPATWRHLAEIVDGRQRHLRMVAGRVRERTGR